MTCRQVPPRHELGCAASRAPHGAALAVGHLDIEGAVGLDGAGGAVLAVGRLDMGWVARHRVRPEVLF